MDALTHAFLLLLVVFVVFHELFPSSRYLCIGAFGLVPDADKVLGVPGLLHSLATVVPLARRAGPLVAR